MSGPLSPELRLLLELLRPEPGPPAPAVVRSGGVPGQVDEARLLGLAERHRVVPPLAARLAAGPAPVSRDAAARADAGSRRNAARALHNAVALQSLLRTLEGKGIEPVVLKGLPLSVATTGGIAGRHSGDIDLLVRPEEVADCLAAVTAAGFTDVRPAPDPTGRHAAAYLDLAHERTLLSREGMCAVDLHWRLLPVRGLLPDEVVSASSTTAEVQGRPVRVLGPEVELLFLVLHAVKSRWERLQWLVDLPLLVTGRQPDPEVVRELVSGEGARACRRALASATALTRDLLGTDALVPFASSPAPAATRRVAVSLDSTRPLFTPTEAARLERLRDELRLAGTTAQRFELVEATLTPAESLLGLVAVRDPRLRRAGRGLRVLLGAARRLVQAAGRAGRRARSQV